MKRINSKSELGSMMIEAIAMLGLIAMVTPVLYKKSAERTSELQDINTAGEIRSIIKAVDDYVGANYNIIAGKNEDKHDVTNSCTGTTTINDEEVDNNSVDYSDLTVDGHKEIPIGHLCEFLPYGVLNADGTARASKLFSDQTKIILRMSGSEDTEDTKGQKVITSFVVTDPHNELPILRASSISSMIGGNGGYATADNQVAGNMGIWGIGDTVSDLGVEVSKHAIVAASIEGISSQSATIEAGDDDSDNFLYRTADSSNEQRTMQNTLFMGSTDEGGQLHGHDIVNINGLAVGTDKLNGHALYIKEGDIQIGEDAVNIKDNGDITVTGDITAKTFRTKDGEIKLEDGDVGAITGTFTGALSALTASFGPSEEDTTKYVTIDADKTTINQPLLVKASGDCTAVCETENSCTCALQVYGGASISGNLHVGGIFNAEDLHARRTLTVGGNDAAKGKYLRVAEGEFKFGALGENENGTPTISATNTTFDVTASGGATIEANDSNKLEVKNTGVTMTGGGSAKVTASDAGNVSIKTGATKTITMNDDDFVVTNANGGTITSKVKSFQITPESKTGTLTVNDNGTKGEVIADQMDAVFSNNNVYLRDSVFRLQNGNDDVVRIGQTADSNAQIDISGQGVTMKDAPDGNKVLRVDLSSNPDEHDTSYPIYIRKGAIEITNGNDQVKAGGLSSPTYIKADRLVSSKLIPDLLTDAEGHLDGIHYVVDPAYTSIMHDIKLTTRGGARLSDILPDFINKGIYIVDNTAPAVGETCGITSGKTLDEYLGLSVDDKLTIDPCLDASQQVSAWAGFVPLPTCPPGYSSVITVGLANAAMAQAGHLPNETDWGYTNRSLKDLEGSPDHGGAYTASTVSPEAFSPGEEGAPYPLYNQKNTWLKSSIKLYEDEDDNEKKGWSVMLGFIYPVAWYRSFLGNNLTQDNKFDTQGDPGLIDDNGNEDSNTQVIWNMFPVYAKTIESYATVYCYFKRGSSDFSDGLVDKNYNQLEKFRSLHSKDNNTDSNVNYLGNLNAEDAEFKGNW